MLQQSCTSLSHLIGTSITPQPCTSLSHLTGTLVTPQPCTKLILLTGTSVTPQPCTSILSPPLRGEGLGVGSFSAATSSSSKGGGWEGAGLLGGFYFLLPQVPPPKGEAGRGLLQAPPPKGEDGRGLNLGVGSISCCYKPLPQRGRLGGAGLKGGVFFLLPQAPPPKGEDGRGLFPSQRTMRGYSTYIYDDPRQILTPRHKKIEYLPEIRTKCPSLPHLIIPFATPNLP